MLITIIIFIIVLSVLVFAHELGHFWMARRFGVRAEEFGFGFPPRAFGVQLIKKEGGGKQWRFVKGNRELNEEDWKHGTVYSVNWLPLGGFVKIKGENGPSTIPGQAQQIDPDEFTAKPIWQRAFILSAGVSMNIILAAVFISFGLMFGMPMALDGISDKAVIENQQIQIVQVMPETPAAKAGVKAGDIVASIDGRTFTAYSELQDYVDQNTGNELTYVLKRGNESIEKKLVPEKLTETGRGGIGVAIFETGLVKYPWYLAIWEGTKSTIFLTWAVIAAFYNLFKELFLGHGVAADLAGPVGIATLTGQVARMGFTYLLQFAAMLSINLAILNFLPFPALDGGRVLFLAIEKIKGRPVKREIEAIAHNIGFALLMLLVIAVTFKDVANIESVRNLWQRIF